MVRKVPTKARPSERHKALFILSYLFLWVSGAIVYVTESRRDSRLKFHSLQAILLGLIVTVLALVWFLQIFAVIVWICGIAIGVLAYDGNDVDIPLLSDYGRSILSK